MVSQMENPEVDCSTFWTVWKVMRFAFAATESSAGTTLTFRPASSPCSQASLSTHVPLVSSEHSVLQSVAARLQVRTTFRKQRSD